MPATPEKVWRAIQIAAAQAAERRGSTHVRIRVPPSDVGRRGGRGCSPSNEEAKLLAGGQTCIPTLKRGWRSRPTSSTSARIAELQGIRVEGGERDDRRDDAPRRGRRTRTVRQARIPALGRARRRIGDAQVRNRGTIGGSLGQHRPGRRLSRRRSWPWARRSHRPARDRGRRLLHRPVRDGAGAGRDRSPRSTSRCPSGRPTQVPPPGLALRMVGVFVARIGGRRAGRGDGRGPDRVPRAPAMERALSRTSRPRPSTASPWTRRTSTATSTPARSTGPTSSRSWPSARSRRWRRGSGREGARPPPAPTLRCSLSLTSRPQAMVALAFAG